MPQETKSMPDTNPSSSPAGLVTELSDARMTMDVLEKAFDFRGDVTLTLKNGENISGYLFDRKKGSTPGDSFLRVMLPTPAKAGDLSGADDKVQVRYGDVQKIAFSDKDPAAGKSFETWVKKYIEKKMAGEKASIESETLD